MSRVPLLSDFKFNDLVETPSGRRALVRGIEREAVLLVFVDDGDECMMRPHLLQLVTPAAPRPFPPQFFPKHAPA